MIICDANIKLTGPKSKSEYPDFLRLIIANVIRDGKTVRMEFITDDFDLAASTITEWYKARWDANYSLDSLSRH